eukprot:340524-Hanusia_phi.AAC.5
MLYGGYQSLAQATHLLSGEDNHLRVVSVLVHVEPLTLTAVRQLPRPEPLRAAIARHGEDDCDQASVSVRSEKTPAVVEKIHEGGGEDGGGRSQDARRIKVEKPAKVVDLNRAVVLAQNDQICAESVETWRCNF